MNQQDIKNLEKELWDAADELRGNSKLTAGEYKDPLLGLVLLRFAQNRYEDAKIVVEENLPINPRTGQKREATKDDFADLPARLYISMTYDNGKEFSKHEDIEKEMGMTVYFARAYASWQRGINENTNGLLRQFIPKGTDFDTVSDDDHAKYVDLINNRPRKRLNWLSPNQVFDRELNSVALGTGI